jgi:plasmid maintenance system antidote protein VapI
MTYEDFLDEVTTLLTEMYDLTDEAAIKLVVDAQANDYFVAHDDKEELRTAEQAKQQQRQVQKKKAV